MITCPQGAYVELAGKGMVTHLHRLPEAPLLIRALFERLGQPLVEKSHSNKTVSLRYPWMGRPAIAFKDVVKARVSAGMSDRLRRMMMGLLTTPRVASIDIQISQASEVQEFITIYYARDFELFESTPFRSRSA